MNQLNLQQAYSRQNWQNWLSDIFGSQVQFEAQAETIDIDRDNIKSIQRFASIKFADGKTLAVLDIETLVGIQIARNRVGLRNLVEKLIDHVRYHGILAFYHSGTLVEYRMSFISSEPKIDENGNFVIEHTTPKRYTYVLGENEKTKTPADRLKIIATKNGKATLEDVKNAFSVETLTKEFYKELSDWYFWALQNVEFPNDLQQNKEVHNSTSVIRLITRLMFVWFLKQKELISDELFDTQELEKMLNYNDKTGSTFYKAILQNLFFATLNNEMGEKRTFIKRQYGVQNYYRYERFFKNKERFLELTKGTPFLNGGLFENLDKNVGEENEIRIDCFSNRMDKEELLTVPDYLFFGEEKQIDLNKIYDTKGKTCKVRGLIDILKTYNFTVEENTSTDIEVALDPELLGKVFENLLASFNPETQTTARKQTGSFYTPREIVDYMVNESLNAYLQETVGDNWENDVRTISALNDIKILDPACGSGAFPMGILQKMVQILQKLDPDNKHWREIQKQKAILETEEAYNIGNKEERQKRLLDIDEAFDNNASDYGRKLFLIENCIFGIDIQAIAIQISKLRFFISLICEQAPNFEKQNLGIRPLPNLETKFVAANTLTGLDKTENLFRTQEIINKENELKEVRHRHFSARTPETKRKYREKDHQLRGEIAGILTNLGYAENTAQMLSDWNPYDQNASSPFFDVEWMFGLTEGFDIVIGNPPYVEAKKLKDIASQLKNYEVATGTSDLSVYFIEKGLNICKSNGTLCYITTNKFFNTGYGKPVRKFLTENQIDKIIDFEQVEVFDNVLVSSVVLGIKKSDKQVENFTYQKFYKLKKDDFRKQFVEQQTDFGKYEQRLLTEGEWSFSDNLQLALKEKIENVGTKVCDLDGVAVFRGVTTGYNPAFIIDAEKKNELILPDNNNAQIIKPLLQGRNIRKWIYNYNNENLIFTKQGINIENYLSIKKYLNGFYSELKPRINGHEKSGRKPGTYQWYEIQDNTAYYLEFEKSEKIIWGLTADKWAFAYDDKQHYLPSNGYILTSEKISIKYLLALLNSNVLKYYFGFIGVMTAGGAYTLKHVTIQQLPVVIFENQQPIISLVNKILFLKNATNFPVSKIVSNEIIASYFEKVIDACVYELYFEEEIKSAQVDVLELIQQSLDKVSPLPIKQQILRLFEEWNDYKNEVRNRIILQETRSESVAQIIKSTN